VPLLPVYFPLTSAHAQGHGLIAASTYTGIYRDCAGFNETTTACTNMLATARAEIGSIDVYNICACGGEGGGSGSGVWRVQRLRVCPRGLRGGRATRQRNPRVLRGAHRRPPSHSPLPYLAHDHHRPPPPPADGPCVFNDTPADGASAVAPVQHTWRAPVPEWALPIHPTTGGPLACIDGGAGIAYLNRPEVYAALHVAPLKWAACTANASFSYTRTMADERVAIYPAILGAGLRVLIYNGEADACVPYTDNEAWVSSGTLGLKLSHGWHAWMADADNVGGYADVYAENNCEWWWRPRWRGGRVRGTRVAVVLASPRAPSPPHPLPLPLPSRGAVTFATVRGAGVSTKACNSGPIAHQQHLAFSTPAAHFPLPAGAPRVARPSPPLPRALPRPAAHGAPDAARVGVGAVQQLHQRHRVLRAADAGQPAAARSQAAHRRGAGGGARRRHHFQTPKHTRSSNRLCRAGAPPSSGCRGSAPCGLSHHSKGKNTAQRRGSRHPRTPVRARARPAAQDSFPTRRSSGESKRGSP
jgi:hypothetical protein